MQSNCIAVLTVLLLASADAHGMSITVNSYDPNSVFSTNTASMDVSLGIDGLVIEDFEDSTLMPGLSMIYDGNSPSSSSSFLPVIDSTRAWDGITSAINYHPNDPLHPRAQQVTFVLAQGATIFGVGLSNLEIDFNPNVQILVNGYVVVSSIADLSGYQDTDTGAPVDGNKNIYVRLDAIGGIINTVSFDIGTPVDDDVEFDHVAFNIVPEPSALFIVAACGLGLVIRKG